MILLYSMLKASKLGHGIPIASKSVITGGFPEPTSSREGAHKVVMIIEAKLSNSPSRSSVLESTLPPYGSCVQRQSSPELFPSTWLQFVHFYGHTLPPHTRHPISCSCKSNLFYIGVVLALVRLPCCRET